MKRYLAFFLTVCLLLGGFSSLLPAVADAAGNDGDTPVWVGNTLEPKGTGTKNDPYLIESASNLQWLSSQMKNGDQILRTMGTHHQLFYADYDSKTEALYQDYCLNSEKVQTLANLEAYKKTLYYESFSKMPYIYVKQVCDIDLNGRSLTPIGAYWPYSGVASGGTAVKGQWFFGHYDGQGHTIKNGTITAGGNNANWSAGLFGNLWGATVENLILDDIHVSGSGCMGVLAARALSPADLGGRAELFEGCKSVIRNVQVKETCTVTHTRKHNSKVYVGGLLGKAYNTEVENCTSGATVTAGINAIAVGGVVGLMTKNSKVIRCVNTGDVICAGGTLIDHNGYGGIVGIWSRTDVADDWGGVLRDCLNVGSFRVNGNASGGNYHVSYGGILGRGADWTPNEYSYYLFYNNVDAGEILGSVPGGFYLAPMVGLLSNLGEGIEDKVYMDNWYALDPYQVSVPSHCQAIPSAEHPLALVLDNGSDASKVETYRVLPYQQLMELPLANGLMSAASNRGYVHPLLGVQTKQNADGTYSLRLIGGVSSLSLDGVTYSVTQTSGGSQKTKETQNTVYTSIQMDGEMVTASDLGYEYLSVLTRDGLEANTTYTFGIQMNGENRFFGRGYAQGSDMVVLRFVNGRVTYVEQENPSIKIDGVFIDRFCVVIPSENYRYEFYVAQALVERIKALTGTELTIVKDSQAKGAHEIRIGNTNRGTSVSVADGEYAVVPTDGCLELLFSGWNATNALIDAIGTTYFPSHANSMDLTVSGSRVVIEANNPFYGYISAPKQVTASTAHIDKQNESDIRIMFYNIWGYTHPHHDASIELLCDFFATYDPDILGLQECKKLEGAVDWLKANGYTMVRFDKNNGYKNNNGQGNPIFFKTSKFQLISSGYACARNSDKGTTWVILKEKATGKTFGVTNSHFSANSNAKNDDGLGTQYRHEDAQAMLDAIQKHILTNSSVEAIITGGDYNTTTSKKVTYNGVTYFPYQTLLNGGVRNIRELVPDSFESRFGSTGSGGAYNATWGVMDLSYHRKQPLANAIDHMMYDFPKGVTLTAKRYYLLHDRLTCTASDHLPQLLDFAWK